MLAILGAARLLSWAHLLTKHNSFSSVIGLCSYSRSILGCPTAENISSKPRTTKKWTFGSTRSIRRRNMPRPVHYPGKGRKESRKPCRRLTRVTIVIRRDRYGSRVIHSIHRPFVIRFFLSSNIQHLTTVLLTLRLGEFMNLNMLEGLIIPDLYSNII